MSRITFFFALLFFVMASCSKDKTDYGTDTESPDNVEFNEAAEFTVENYKISIVAANGSFYKGYNEVRVLVSEKETGLVVRPESVTFLPVQSGFDDAKGSCPHRSELQLAASKDYYLGYVVFTQESSQNTVWNIQIDFTNNGSTYSVNQDVSVGEQKNKNLGMVSFMGSDEEQYCIALIAPYAPKVGENDLTAGIYKLTKGEESSYTEVRNYILKLDPRMPDPSMGNHSSPNNKDLVQQADGFYKGVVNYTMKGDWTLNFILLNEAGDVIRGTEVPKEHSPSVVGKKSDLYIDVVL